MEQQMEFRPLDRQKLENKHYVQKLLKEVNDLDKCESFRLIDHGFPTWDCWVGNEQDPNYISDFDRINYRYEIERTLMKQNINLCGTTCKPSKEPHLFNNLPEVIDFLELTIREKKRQ